MSTIKIKEISSDRNGNKIVKFSINGKSKSIQTLGNLPKTHREFSKGTNSFSTGDLKMITDEIMSYNKKSLNTPLPKGMTKSVAKAISVTGLRKADGTLKKGYKYAPGGKIVKVTPKKK